MKKKVIVLTTIFLLLIIVISLFIYQYKILNINVNKSNLEFEKFGEEIYGRELITLINKAMDNNKSLNVEKDNNNKYIDNKKDSIKIDVKFLEKDDTIDMESISNLGIEQFIKFYSKCKFKCTESKYHNKTKKISYLKFEEI